MLHRVLKYSFVPETEIPKSEGWGEKEDKEEGKEEEKGEVVGEVEDKD
jgi:hypothetical protein